MSFDPKLWSGIFDDLPPTRPTGAGQVVGFRLCAIDDEDGRLQLKSIGVGKSVWRPGVNVATCRAGRTHRKGVPAWSCTCGLYGCTDIAAMVRALGVPSADDDEILVGVQAWGTLIVHPWGWRAQYARIVALTDQLPSRVLRDMDGRVIEVRAKRGIDRGEAEELADTYGVTLIDLAGLPGVLAGFGQFIQEEGRG